MKKIIDDRGRFFGIISFIDVIVIAVVIVLALVVLLRFNSSDNPVTASNTVPVKYTVVIPGVRLSTAEQIVAGDNLYTEMSVLIGTITDVSWVDAYSPEPLSDGTIVLGMAHERYDATLTVEAQCSTSEGRYYANRVYELSANSEQKLQTRYNVFTAYIASVIPG